MQYLIEETLHDIKFNSFITTESKLSVYLQCKWPSFVKSIIEQLMYWRMSISINNVSTVDVIVSTFLFFNARARKLSWN